MTQRYSPKRALWESVTELGLAPRPKNALQAAGITTLLDLVRYSRAELLRVKNFGIRDANEIEEKLGCSGSWSLAVVCSGSLSSQRGRLTFP